MLMGSVDGVSMRFHHHQLLERASAGSYSSFPRQLMSFPRSHNSQYCCRVMASRRRDIRRQQSKQKKTPTSLPCLVLPPDFARSQIEDHHYHYKEEDYYYCYYSLGERRVLGVKDSSNKRLLPWEKDLLLPADAYCVGSSHGWLAYLNPNDDCSLFLFKHPPLSSQDFFASAMFRLPPLQTHPRISAVVTRKAAAAHPNRPHPVTRDYFCWYAVTCSHPPTFIPETFLSKLVLSSRPSPSSFPPADTGCVALAVLQGRALTFCRLGDSQWTPLDESAGAAGYYNDIIYSVRDGHFYCLCDGGWKREHELVSWDLANPSHPRKAVFNPTPRASLLSREWRPPTPEDYQYLVECSGEILMVLGFMEDGEDGTVWAQSQGFCDPGMVEERRRTVRFDVYQLDRAKKNWEMVEGIGDHALFLGLNHAFSLSTRDFPQLMSNSIYFTDHPNEAYCTRTGSPPPGHPNMGIFNMRTESIRPCYPSNAKSIHPLPVWVAPP